MDRKSIIILVLCFLALILWQPLVVNKIWPPKPAKGTNGAPATAVAPTNTASGTQQAAIAPSSAAPQTPVTSPSSPIVTDAANRPEEILELRTPEARYTFTSHGGGIKGVELVHYPERVARHRKQRTSTNDVATLNTPSRAPALAMIGAESIQGDGVYTLTRTSSGVRAEKELTNGLSVVKEFTPSSNYLVHVKLQIQNSSGQAIVLPQREVITGTATPLSPEDDGSTIGVMWYDGADSKDIGAGWFANATLGCIPGTPRELYTGGQSNVFWTAVHNQFFTMAVMSKVPAQQLNIRRFELPAPTAQDLRENSRLNKKPYGYEAAILYPAQQLGPGQSIEKTLDIYAGPKEYRVLAAIAGGANNNIDEVMGFGGFFGFFSKALLLSMNWLHNALTLSYGWAIIAITIIIKILFWPLTRASTRSMKRMAALQPQMKAIQQKYKDDPVKMNRKTMEFMKEHKVSPLGGCLPMLLQMPVFIGFFYMIRSAIELRGASWFWVADLSQPDTLFMIPGINFPFNLLPLIMGATMLWQAHLTPPSPGMDPMQAKIMKYMPLMFMVFLYNFSAGLTLYWTVQNLLTILQTKLTKEAPTAEVAAMPATPQAPRKKRK